MPNESRHPQSVRERDRRNRPILKSIGDLVNARRKNTKRILKLVEMLEQEAKPCPRKRSVEIRLSDMYQDERGYLVVPHEMVTGAGDCDGCLIVVEHGSIADLKCNSCGAVVDRVPLELAGPRLMELASSEMCSARCPHCGANNVFLGYSFIEAFICRECGEGVNLERQVQ